MKSNIPKFKGNIAADAVLACIRNAKRSPRKLKFINLQATWWEMFKKHTLKLAPEIGEIPDEGIMFKDVTIRKGTQFMTERLTMEWYPFSGN